MAKLIPIVRILIAAGMTFAVCLLLPDSTPDDLERPVFRPIVNQLPPTHIDGSILLISKEASDNLWPVAPLWADVLFVLAQFNPTAIIDMVPLAALDTWNNGNADRKADVETQFAEEFSLVESNITTLFDAIRLGSVRAAEVTEYIEALQQLVSDSRDRLLAEVLTDNATPQSVGSVRTALGAGRYGSSLDSVDMHVPTRKNAVTMVLPFAGEVGTYTFRTLSVTELVRYIGLANDLYQSLTDMELAGYFHLIEPERYPTLLWEHTISLKSDVVIQPGESSLNIWRNAIDDTMTATEALLYGDSQERLLAGFDELLVANKPDESRSAQITEEKRAVYDSFQKVRSIYTDFRATHAELAHAFDDAVVIVGEAGDTAHIVNAVLTESFAFAPVGWYRIRWLLVVALLAAIVLSFMRPMIAGVTGFFLVVVAVATGVVVFIRMGIWFDPIIVGTTTAVCVLISTLTALILRAKIIAGLVGRFKPRFPGPMLRRIFAKGVLPTGKITVGRAVILAAQYIGRAADPRLLGSDEQNVALLRFQKTTAREIIRLGGVILSAEGFVLVAGFDIPVDRRMTRRRTGKYSSTDRYRRICLHILDHIESVGEAAANTYFGLDLGECCFVSSPLSGYGATGNSVNYARRLSGLAPKYDCHAAVTGDVIELVNETWDYRKLGSVVGKAVTQARAFYAVTGRRQQPTAESAPQAPST